MSKVVNLKRKAGVNKSVRKGSIFVNVCVIVPLPISERACNRFLSKFIKTPAKVLCRQRQEKRWKRYND